MSTRELALTVMEGTLRSMDQEPLIDRAVERFGSGDRFAAGWLEGSLAAGTHDSWSDVDLHLAIPDGSWESLSNLGPALLAELGPVRGVNRAQLGPYVVLYFATTAGPQRVDLYLERCSSVGLTARKAAPRVLFDHAGIASGFLVDPGTAILPHVAIQLHGLVNAYFYGFMWPARLLGRELAGSALLNATLIAYQFLVPAWLAQDSPAEAHRELLHAERFLSNSRRAELDAMLDGLARGFIARAADNGEAFRRTHLPLVDAILTNLRAACGQHGVPWPDDAEAEARQYLDQHLG